VLYSQFFVNEDSYVISAKEIVEIIPYVSLKLAPMFPDYISGLMNYHGSSIPIIDICQLLIGRFCEKKLSTRIIIVKKNTSIGDPVMFGFMVEKATEMVVIDASKFKPQAMKNLESPTNGPVAVHQEYLVERISIGSVFERLDKKLFSEQGVLSSKVAS